MSAKLGSASLSEPCYWILSRTKLYIQGKYQGDSRKLLAKFRESSQRFQIHFRKVPGRFFLKTRLQESLWNVLGKCQVSYQRYQGTS